MPVLPAALLVAGVTVYWVLKSSTRSGPTVTFAKPTTVFPAVTAALAALGATITIILGMGSDLSPIWVLVLAAVVGMAIFRIGGTTNGNRVVYDRGFTRMPAGKFFGILLVAAVCFMALIYQG